MLFRIAPKVLGLPNKTVPEFAEQNGEKIHHRTINWVDFDLDRLAHECV